MHPRLLLALVCVTATLSFGPAAHARSVLPPRSYSELSPDGRYIFVMISSSSAEWEVKRWNEPIAEQILRLRAKYKRTGMYLNDGSTDPIWTVDWYAYKVQVANGGRHIVRLRPMYSIKSPAFAERVEDEGVGFFEDGKMLRVYRIGELMDLRSFLPDSLFHYNWLDSESFDGVGLTYIIHTYDGNRFTFDVRTGEMIKSSRPAAAIRWAVIGIPLAVASALFIWVWRIRKRRNSAKFSA